MDIAGDTGGVHGWRIEPVGQHTARPIERETIAMLAGSPQDPDIPGAGVTGGDFGWKQLGHVGPQAEGLADDPPFPTHDEIRAVVDETVRHATAEPLAAGGDVLRQPAG